MSEMVERAAIAAFEAYRTACAPMSGRWEDQTEFSKGIARQQARAVIEAMRTPTEAMNKVAEWNATMAHREIKASTAGWLYKVMIEEALK